MELKLFLNKNINENANYYFDKAKKLKSKIPGIEKTIEKTKKEIEEFEEKKETYLKKKEKEEKINFHKKKEWFEKFRFTYTSNGFLFVIGKDAGTNEILVKKHTEEKDIIFHTQAPGSPYGILKNGKNASKEDIEEAAQFLCCFSSQWKRGFGSADAFWVNPDQVTKKAQSGEFMSKGSFMVYGNKNILKNINLRICLGVQKQKIQTEDEIFEYDELFSGSQKACEKFCGNRFIKLEPGNINYKALNKEIKKQLKTHIEDLPKYIPNDCRILKK